MRASVTVSVLLALACAAAFAGSSSIEIAEGFQRFLGFVSLPGFVGIFGAAFLISAAGGSSHGAGEPMLIGVVSILINTPLFWVVIRLITMVMNAIRRSLRSASLF
jgi:hypothetical protein